MPIYNPEQQGPLDIGPGTPGYFGPGDGVSSPSPTAPPTSGGTTNGGFGGIMDFISKLFPGSDGSGFGGINPNMIPFLTTALNQYNNSGKYMDLATKYADKMDPFGGQRGYYQDRLRQLTEDPNKYLENSPDYRAALKQGIGALDSSMSAKGFTGSGHAADEAQGYGSMLAAQYLDRDRKSLMEMAGSQIGPAAAAALISQGMKGSIDSQNQALSDLFAAFTKPKTNGGPGTGGGGPGGGSGNPAADTADFIKKAVGAGMSIADAIKMAGTLKGNFTVNPGSMGGYNGTGDSQITGPGGSAPGSDGPQFDWDKYAQDPEGYLKSLGMQGGNPSDPFNSYDMSKYNEDLGTPIDNPYDLGTDYDMGPVQDLGNIDFGGGFDMGMFFD